MRIANRDWALRLCATMRARNVTFVSNKFAGYNVTITCYDCREGMEEMMTIGTCLYCGVPIEGQTTKRRYCSGRCKQKAYRHRNKIGGYRVVTRQCAYCHKSYKGFGRARYCSDACKQKMYRKRKKDGPQKSF